MNWSNEAVLKFLTLYQKHRCLWHPKDKFHKNRARNAAAWNDIVRNIGIKCTIPQLKKKKESLMSAYRAYKLKVKRSLTSEAASGVYQPVWYAFSTMDSFLGTVYGCNPDLNTEDDENEDTEYENIDDTDTNYDILIQEDTESEKKTKQIDFVQEKIKPTERGTREPPKPQDTRTDQAVGLSQTSHIHDNEDDECGLYAKFLAKKLRRLTEERRNFITYKIDKLFYEESFSRSNTSGNMAASSIYIKSSPNYHGKPSNMYVNDDSMSSNIS